MNKRVAAFNVLVAGIGGQGVLLISKVLAEAALQEGWYACRTESRGLSQRGGSVISVVRFSAGAISPCIDFHFADLVLGLDALEGCRAMPYLSPSGALLVNGAFTPPNYSRGDHGKESEADTTLAKQIDTALSRSKQPCIKINLKELAMNARCPMGLNSVLLGAGSAFLPIKASSLRAAMAKFLKPQHLIPNLGAFDHGVASQAKQLAS